MNIRALVPVIFVGVVSPALAESSDLSGRWGQVSSTGGECPTCLLSIAKNGDRFVVKANNGWTAEVSEPDIARGAFFTGAGRWSALVERPFRIFLFVREDGDLLVKMTTPQPNGSNQVVSAVFHRDASV